MFWKKFGQAQAANKPFNRASDQWRRRQQFLLQGDAAGAEQSCLEVIRLCQLSIQADEQMGDAYVLLSNALSVAADISGPSDPERYEFLQSRAAAVIHFWYSLPNRGYPVTKNTKQGLRLWEIMVDEVRRDRTQSGGGGTMALMESYRDSLATETILPSSFEKIKSMVIGTALMSTAEPIELEFVSLPPETLEFLVKIIPKTLQSASNEVQPQTDRRARITEMVDELGDDKRIFDAGTQLLALIQQAHQDKDFRQAIGWLRWLEILQIYSAGRDKKYLPESDTKEEEIQKKLNMPLKLLSIMIDAASKAEDYDALILASGFCDWVGLEEMRDKMLEIMSGKIGKQAIADRLLNINQHPRMSSDKPLVDRLKGYLPGN